MAKKKNIANSHLKCWMRVATNGKPYRACAVPAKDKLPKHQVRENPRPEGRRKKPYLVAYPNKQARKDEQAQRRKDKRVSTAPPKTKAQEYKKGLGKKVADMTKEERRIYERLRKPKPVVAKKRKLVIKKKAITSTDASGKVTQLFYKKGRDKK